MISRLIDYLRDRKVIANYDNYKMINPENIWHIIHLSIMKIIIRCNPTHKTAWHYTVFQALCEDWALG